MLRRPTFQSLPAAAALMLPAAATPAPPATLALLDGGTAQLDAWRGRVVIVYYWATWCAPCRQELKDVDALVTASGGRLVAVAVLAERHPDLRLARAATAGLATPVAVRFLTGGERFPLAHSAVPTTYLLDRAGRVVFMHAGALPPATLAAHVQPLLAP